MKNNNHFIATVIFLFFVLEVFSQNKSVSFDSLQDTVSIKEIVITATQTEHPISDIPKAITKVNAKELEQKHNVSIIDALTDEPGIWVKKEGNALASDPQMRGFAGYYINELIDGNSLGTLAGEGGPAGSKLSGKLDPLSIQRVEVIRGPSSILYGTNAIGGVINFITKDPMPYSKEGFSINGNIQNIYSSADHGSVIRAETEGSSSRVRFLLGASYQSVGDLMGGGNEGKLSPSSGERYNIDFKSELKLSDKQFIKLSFQQTQLKNYRAYFNPDEITTATRGGISATYKNTASTFFWDEFTATAFLQNKETSTLNGDNAIGFDYLATTQTIAAELLWKKEINTSHHLLYGLHYNIDYSINKLTTDSGKIWGKTVPDSKWMNVAPYVQDEWTVTNKFSIIGALRYDRYLFNASPDALFLLPAGNTANDFNVSQLQEALSGGVGLVYHLPHYSNLTGNISRGFRQPQPQLGISNNTYAIVVPAINLKPEIATTYEIGLKTNQSKIQLAMNFYYTSLTNFVVTLPGSYNGQSWYDWNHNGVQDPSEITYYKQNAGQGWVNGIEIQAKMNWNMLFQSLSPGWFVSGGFNWMDGQIAGDYLPKLSPVSGNINTGFESTAEKKYWCYLSVFMVDQFSKIPDTQHASDPAFWVNPQNVNDGIFATLPGYVIFNLRSGYAVRRNTTVIFSVENFTNQKYRVKDSRMDASGINFVLGLKIYFGAKQSK